MNGEYLRILWYNISYMELLAHHQSVVETILRSEEYRRDDGLSPRSSVEMASDWVAGQLTRGPLMYRQAWARIDVQSELVDVVSRAIDAYRRGELEVVDDFKLKRDEICDACGASMVQCWRKNDKMTMAQAIEMIRRSIR